MSPQDLSSRARRCAGILALTACVAVLTACPDTSVSSEPKGSKPNAPTIGTATAGNAQASIAFTASTDPGSSPITNYIAICTSGTFSISNSGPASPIVITGLVNGTSYSCTVSAVNAVGTGPSSASVSVTPFTTPSAPTIGVVTAGNGTASVAFSAGASGGSAITGYTASCVATGSAAVTNTGTTSPILISGLTNGTQYSCTVIATNAAGNSPASAAGTVTPATAPGAPTIGTVTAGNGTALVAFTAPASNGGSTITGYTASCVTGSSAALTATGTASPISVSGLTNGLVYDCSVKATNAMGTSAASATAQVTPVGPPPAPTIGTATAGDASASIAFTAPTSNGGSAITSYTVSCQTGTSAAVTATGSASPINVTGLTNGSSYTCTVKATNSAGAGTASAGVTVTPRTVPGAPTIGTATAGSTTASIAFTAPTSTGGATITGYTVSCTAGANTITATGTASPISVTGLTNSTTYSCSVKATNAAGNSAASGTVSVTPLASLAPVNTSNLYCSTSYSATNTSVNLLSQVSWTCNSTTRTMTSTQVPEYPTHSTFPGNGNNAMAVQSGVPQTFTLTPAQTGTTTQRGNITGWARNGVKFDPATAETCPTKTYCPGGGSGTYESFNVEALGQTLFSAGVDNSNAHMQPGGAYHYHGMPVGYMGYISNGDTASTPKIQYYFMGWAVDGFPVYAKYGYTSAMDATSALKEMKSNWRKRTSSELAALYPDRPSSVAIGTFTQDWVFDSATVKGDLDDCNGRFGVTPDFPNGIYHYFITTDFPYIQRCLKGTATALPTGGPPPFANRAPVRRPPATIKPPKKR